VHGCSLVACKALRCVLTRLDALWAIIPNACAALGRGESGKPFFDASA